jgi:hypothetical protein
MKKINTFLFVAFLLTISIRMEATPIDSTRAMMAAKQFFVSKSGLRSGQLPEVKVFSVKTSAAGDVPYYYVIGNQLQEGWIILSGDDRILPVIAHSETGIFSGATNPAFDWWMEGKAKEIEAILSADRNESNLRSAKIHRGWMELLSGTIYSEPEESNLKSTAAYTPGTDLLDGIKWNQSNSWAPAQAGNNSPAGCVATAMGQVLKYWGRKNNITQLQGHGAYEYLDHASNNIFRSVDYSTRIYNLAAMSEDTPSDAIRNLLYDLGVSVRMAYSSIGSGALNEMIPSALFCHFGFKPAEYADSSYYNNNWQRWENKIVNEINAERPVIYGGDKPKEAGGGGHSFVLSGYRNGSSNNKEYHFNWGWSGLDDGWFVLQLSETGNVVNYRLNQDAVFGIEPDENGNALSYSISDVTMMTEKNDNCFMFNKFTAGNLTGMLKFNLTNHSSGKSTIPVVVRFYSNSANGMAVSVASVRGYTVNIKGNTTENHVIDGDMYLSYWNDLAYMDVNCDIGTELKNSDNITYTIDIARNPHVITKVSDFTCATDISSPQTATGNFICYPNPARDHVFIQTDEDINFNHISIINIFGEKLNPTVIEPSTDEKIRIDISSLPDGLYFIHAGKRIYKFIKKVLPLHNE